MSKITALAFTALLVVVSCSSDDADPNSSDGTAVDATAVTSSTTASPTTSGPATTFPTTSSPATTAAPPATTIATSTAAPATTAAPAGSVPAKVEILRVGPGAGSGEATVVVDRKPPGWTRFKVSFDGPNGPGVRAEILDVQDLADGVAIVVRADNYAGGLPLTIAVSWVNDAGVTSAIDYTTCNNGIPLSGGC